MKRYDTARLATGVFLLSEAVFFGFLIAAYLYYAANGVRGPQAANSLDPARTLLFTVCLIASSATLWLAERRLRASHTGGFRLWTGATILLGAVFLAGQGLEYAGLLARSISPERNLFGATFFTLTGFHGFHVLCGLVCLVLIWLVGAKPVRGTRSGVAAVSLYWHFVDAVWIVIYSLVYLRVWV